MNPTAKVASLLLALLGLSCSINANERPNVLWISSEDLGPHLTPYGDQYAHTPNLDRFAQTGLLYRKASSTAPVCAPARTTIISGMYAPSVGAQHMRSRVPAPSWMKFFPKYLQEAGYYTTNNSKEDYNLVVADKGWNESSPTATWKNRPEGQPFFAVFNFIGTHESQIRNQNDDPRHDPTLAPVPPYHPDTPEVRKDWAQYYDRIALLDEFFQQRLQELEDAGLKDDTIIFFWGDHGSGMPRGKRYPGWSGLHVPLIIHVPEKFQRLAPSDYLPGGETDRLVGFVDFAPTMLSIVGIEPPEYHQGRAFMGEYEKPGLDYSFGFKGRMDERLSFSRSVTDGRYVLIRNYMTHLPHGQYMWYQQLTPSTRVWYEKFHDGELDEVQSAYWEPHPREELFDLANDPHEIHDLADSKEHKATAERLGRALDEHMLETRDLGFQPEPMLRQIIDKGESPAEALVSLFEKQSNPIKSALAELNETKLTLNAFRAMPPEQRYWRLIRILESGKSMAEEFSDLLILALADPEPIVGVAAGECLARLGKDEITRSLGLNTLLHYARFPENELILSLHALNGLDNARTDGASLPDEAKNLTTEHPKIPRWAGSYRARVIDRF